MVLTHVILGLPGGLLTGRRNSLRACLAGVLIGSLIKCPNQLILLLLIFILHFSYFVILYSSLFDSFLGHFVPSILLRKVL